MLQARKYVPVTRQLLHSLLDKAPRIVDKHGMHGWSVSGHHMRPWPDASRHSLPPSSLKHNLSRYEDNLLDYTLFPRLMYGAMFGLKFLEPERLRPCFGKGGRDDVERAVRHAMAYGGHVTFDSIHVFKRHNEPGGLAHTYGAGKSYKRKREADHRQSEMQLLQWVNERATNAIMRKRRDAVHAWFSRSKFLKASMQRFKATQR